MSNQISKYRILGQHGVNAMRAGALEYISAFRALFNPRRECLTLPPQRLGVEQLGDHAKTLGVKIGDELRHVAIGKVSAESIGERGRGRGRRSFRRVHRYLRWGFVLAA